MTSPFVEAAELVGEPQPGGLLIVADHASSHVPGDVDLGIRASLLANHIAVDIGVDPLARALANKLSCAALIARASRLVVDLNREADEPNVIPSLSDGHRIPGNEHLSDEQRKERLKRFWYPYHALVDATVERTKPPMLVSLHSFTPRLLSRPDEQRPWQIGVLYNEDDRAARIAIPLLGEAGLVTGDNQPYSGKVLNATMNRHAENRGIPYLGLEVRQDLVAEPAQVKMWADRLAPVIEAVAGALAREVPA